MRCDANRFLAFILQGNKACRKTPCRPDLGVMRSYHSVPRHSTVMCVEVVHLYTHVFCYRIIRGENRKIIITEENENRARPKNKIKKRVKRVHRFYCCNRNRINTKILYYYTFNNLLYSNDTLLLKTHIIIYYIDISAYSSVDRFRRVMSAPLHRLEYVQL